jgi:hypothetical protein
MEQEGACAPQCERGIGPLGSRVPLAADGDKEEGAADLAVFCSVFVCATLLALCFMMGLWPRFSVGAHDPHPPSPGGKLGSHPCRSAGFHLAAQMMPQTYGADDDDLDSIQPAPRFFESRFSALA